VTLTRRSDGYNEKGCAVKVEAGALTRNGASLAPHLGCPFLTWVICYTDCMVKTLEQAIAEVENLPVADQEQIGRTLLSHIEKLRALRAEIDKGIRSLGAGQGRESSIEDFIRQKTK
jgi:hypothetical protein